MTVNQALEQIIETSNLRPDVAEVLLPRTLRERKRERGERGRERVCLCVGVGLFRCECLVSLVMFPGGRREANQMCMRAHGCM